jgi:tRNA-dihydrouridine synthase B
MQEDKLLNLMQDNNYIALAPMAGITDLPFRMICKKYGASVVYSEMISAKALTYHNEKSIKMLCTTSEESPCVVQLFGSDAKVISSAAEQYINSSLFSGIDINMGCPVPKVVKSGEGSALMRSPQTAYDIIRTLKDTTSLPVSVKIRSGWNENEKNAAAFSLLMQKAGADIIIVHPRTREQYYSGKADFDIIREVKQSVSVPVIANGDITHPLKAEEVLNYTLADGIMIGRGATGNPWIFSQILQYRKEGTYVMPSIYEMIDQIKEHMQLACKDTSEPHAIASMRKHILWYTKGMPNSAKVRNLISTAVSQNEIMEILNTMILKQL